MGLCFPHLSEKLEVASRNFETPEALISYPVRCFDLELQLHKVSVASNFVGQTLETEFDFLQLWCRFGLPHYQCPDRSSVTKSYAATRLIALHNLGKEYHMSDSDIIRAWKDARFRQTFSKSELAELPEHPAGTIDLTEADLSNGGKITQVPTCTRVISEPCINC